MRVKVTCSKRVKARSGLSGTPSGSCGSLRPCMKSGGTRPCMKSGGAVVRSSPSPGPVLPRLGLSSTMSSPPLRWLRGLRSSTTAANTPAAPRGSGARIDSCRGMGGGGALRGQDSLLSSSTRALVYVSDRPAEALLVLHLLLSSAAAAVAATARAMARSRPPSPPTLPLPPPPLTPPPPPPLLEASACRDAAVAATALAPCRCACDLQTLACSSETEACRSTISPMPRSPMTRTSSDAASLAAMISRKSTSSLEKAGATPAHSAGHRAMCPESLMVAQRHDAHGALCIGQCAGRGIHVAVVVRRDESVSDHGGLACGEGEADQPSARGWQVGRQRHGLAPQLRHHLLLRAPASVDVLHQPQQAPLAPDGSCELLCRGMQRRRVLRAWLLDTLHYGLHLDPARVVALLRLAVRALQFRHLLVLQQQPARDRGQCP
eukprot:scaffold33571_cov59-Phaeocystis_antarctica.AAC.3